MNGNRLQVDMRASCHSGRPARAFLPLLCSIVVAFGACSVFGQAPPRGRPPENALAAQPSSVDDAAPVLLALQQSLVAAIERSEQSVVAIARARRNEEPRLLESDYIPAEFATGVIVDAQGLILTNAHVLGKPADNDYAVWVSGRPFVAKVKALDPWIDLAILSIDAKQLNPITFGNTHPLKKGQFVICLGNPHAIARDGNASATWGIISNLDRKAPPPRTPEQAGSKNESLHQYGTLIQTDAKLLQGTSGGALLNLHGEMIGLTTSIAALEGYDRAAGYAIPMSEAILRVIDQLKQGRQPEYGFLGVAPTNLELAEIQNNELGAKLNGVEIGTPASRFGLRRDDVITHINSVPVRSHLDLIRLVSLSPIGTDVEIQLRRQNVLLRRTDELTKSVVLTKRFVAAHEQALWTEPTPSWRGISVDYSTAIPYFFQQSANMDPEGCLVLTQVQQDSPAWKAGLRPGVFMTHANGQRIFTPDNFWAAVRDIAGETVLRVTVPIQGETEIKVPAA